VLDGGAMVEELFRFIQGRHQHQPSLPVHAHLKVTPRSQAKGLTQLPGDGQLTFETEYNHSNGPTVRRFALRSIALRLVAPQRRQRRRGDPLGGGFELYGGARGAGHQHAVGLAEHFHVNPHANHGVGTQQPGPSAEFLQRHLPRPLQGGFLGPGPAVHQIADRGEDVAEQVGAEDRLAVHQAQVVADRPPLQAGCGG